MTWECRPPAQRSVRESILRVNSAERGEEHYPPGFELVMTRKDVRLMLEAWREARDYPSPPWASAS